MPPHDNRRRFQDLIHRWMARPLAAEAAYAADETGHTQMPLSAMRPGDLGHVLYLCPDCEVREHLLELGFTPGTEIVVLRVAPLGDPMTVRVRGYQLSLRRREAEAVKVRRCPPGFMDATEFMDSTDALDANAEAGDGARGE